ncbi:MAG: PucR family transcriptional regulator [Clostridiales bacterium]|nr:PucR family transcriptional regulator [Candidatus Crickella caballi]
MRITVEDCLKLDAFKGCTVLTCRNKTDRRVRSVSVLDEHNLDMGVERNGIKEQMVITHLWSSRDDIEAQKKAVTALGKRGIAALVIYLNENGISKVDEEVLQEAEKANLVIITIEDTGKVTYSMLIEQVLDKILYGHNYSDNILNNTIFHLLNFEKHSNFSIALKKAAVANGYQVVLMTEEFNPILTIETRHVISIDDAIQLARHQDAFKPDVFSKVNIGEIVTYWGYINIEDKKYILVIVDNEDNYSATEMKKLAEIIELAIGMWKYTPERDSRAEFIKSAIRGDLSFCYTLLEESGLKGMQYCSVYYVKSVDDDSFYDIIDKYKKQYGFSILTHADGDDSYGIVYDEEGAERGIEIKNACLDMYEELKSGRKDVRIFHVTGIETLDAATDGFKLINKTAPYVEAIFPYKRVFSKYEMSTACDCVTLHSGGSSLKKMYLDLIEPFEREVSENKGKLLLDTLATFVLDAGMNSNKTAEFMQIHNNTVQYRLKRINEILGADMTANRVIPGLTMALALKRLEEV